MSYTVADTPAIVDRIEKDLARVQLIVRHADPFLKSLILTGGFARGEGAMLDGRPQNDYDFVAVRGLGRPRKPYGVMSRELQLELGLHVDLSPIQTWRIPRVRPTIFWYETALRGRVLYGEDFLSKIPIRSIDQIDPAEGLRLLVNRAAGLLLVTESAIGHEHRIQAAKALLAALDAHLLSLRIYPPSQTERWEEYLRLRDEGRAPPVLEEVHAWLEWAYRFKVDPGAAPEREHVAAWRTAARAVLDAVPTALAQAGLGSLSDYARSDPFVDHLVYLVRSGHVTGARRLVRNPTSRVRVATLQLLEASLDGKVRPEAAQHSLRLVARRVREPLRLLDGLRKATLQ